MFIKNMLKEELQNSLQIRKDYERALKKIPKGALVKKIIGKHPYYYLAFRQGGKVRFDYIGKLDNDEIRKHNEAREYRARYRKKLSEVNKQINFIRKVLRGNISV
ncbi:hypothetical protein ACFLS1_05695 [Verrucomicrobiota bacterium]